MNRLIINGCYDRPTLTSLLSFGVTEFAFDLRGKSPNLVIFKDLQEMLGELRAEKIYLIFENDRRETILSFLDLITEKNPSLIFTDSLSAAYYDSFQRPFLWTFHPFANWREILLAKELQGIILPLQFQEDLQSMPEFWESVDRRMVDIFLSPETIQEAEALARTDVLLSLNLGREWESGFRKIDPVRLSEVKVWRKNENTLGQ